MTALKPTDTEKKIWNMSEHIGWGNSLCWYNFEKRRIHGWLSNPIIKIGDEIRCKMESGKTAIFTVTELDYQSNPTDMFFGTVEDNNYLED